MAEDINVGAISEALNNKADRDFNNTQLQSKLDTKANTDLSNISSNYDYVVKYQKPTSGNGYTWYRKYKSGWVEQGGILPNTSSWANHTLTLPIAMATNNYNTVPEGVWSQSDSLGLLVLNKTKTQIQFHYFGKQSSGYTTWEAKGMAA